MSRGAGIHISLQGAPKAARESRFCFQCKEVGWLRKAHRIVPKKGPMCDEHWRHDEGLPQLNAEARALTARWKALQPREEVPAQTEPEGETPMRGSTQPPEQSVIDAMREDHAAGMSIEQIRKKHGVGWPTAKKYCGNGRKAAKNRPNTSGRVTMESQNGVGVTITVSTSSAEAGHKLADAIWASLPLEKKADLLKSI